MKPRERPWKIIANPTGKRYLDWHDVTKGAENQIIMIRDEVLELINGQRASKGFKTLRSKTRQALAHVLDVNKIEHPFTDWQLRSMIKGLSPHAPRSQRTLWEKPLKGNEWCVRYNMHHMTPIKKGWEVLNFENIVIVTPLLHDSLLDESYHYGEYFGELKKKIRREYEEDQKKNKWFRLDR